MSAEISGILAIWHGIEPASDSLFHHWHGRVHMPERVAVPGIDGARRYISTAPTQLPYFTLYEAASAAVFNSPGYLGAGAPRQWDVDVRKTFTNFTRGVFSCVAESGFGMGGFAATVMLAPSSTIEKKNAQRLCRRVSHQTGIIRARIGLIDREITRSSKLRPLPIEPEGGALLLLEAVRAEDLTVALRDLAAVVASELPGCALLRSETYSLSHSLQPKDPDRTEIESWVR